MEWNYLPMNYISESNIFQLHCSILECFHIHINLYFICLSGTQNVFFLSSQPLKHIAKSVKCQNHKCKSGYYLSTLSAHDFVCVCVCQRFEVEAGAEQ